jgi:hypothetical protein
MSLDLPASTTVMVGNTRIDDKPYPISCTASLYFSKPGPGYVSGEALEIRVTCEEWVAARLKRGGM